MPELIWPFRTKSDSQYRRIDEGWDLQTDIGDDVLAVLPGLLHYAHDPGTDGGHFGASYPWVSLDEPYGPHIGYYLGHTYPVLREGTRVAQGDVVSHTGNPGNGGAPPGWLEIGWWRNGPEGKGGQWTPEGQDMHDQLILAPVFNPTPIPIEADMKNLVLLSPNDGGGASYIWDTATGHKYSIPDQATAQGFISAGIEKVGVAQSFIDAIG